MDQTILKTLQLLGLSPKEIQFFQANFLLGPSAINEVAKKARLERSTAYLIAEELLAKGLIEEDLKTYKKQISVLEPKKLLEKLSARQRTLRRQELALEERLPELEAQYAKSEIKPKVRVYQGNQGLLAVWKDILSSKTELLIWTNQEAEDQIFTDHAHYSFIDERTKKGISARVLALDNPKGQELVKLDQKSLRQTKLLPEMMSFSAETYIYDNKIAILDYNKDIIGVIIESEPMVQSQKAIFELNWQNIS